MTYTRRLDSPGTHERAAVGGKGAGLARLAAAGVPVPAAFAVTTAAYADLLAEGDLGSEIERLAARTDHGDAAQVTEVTDRIRSRILGAPVPEVAEKEIRRAYAELGDDAFVAVRSSGTAEDMGEASFAGLYDSYLDVRGADAVVDAVRHCWASLWTARCASYRHRLGLDDREAQVAVVVQRMVAAESAGVMFTANPLNGRTDEIVVNSTWGLGEAIASGAVTPDEIVLDAATLRVKRATTGSKTLRIDRASDGPGTVRTDTTAADRDRRSLDDTAARDLALLGRRIVEACGGLPQDIEWAREDGELFVVQSRDVTGAEFHWDDDVETWQTAPDPDDVVWSHTWAQQYWTGGVTPLMYSLRGRELRDSDRRLFTLWGFDELVDVRRFKYRRATVYMSADADRVYYRLALPPRLRRHTLANLPPDWREEARTARFDPATVARMYARIRLLTTDHGPFRSIGSIYRFIEENTPRTVEYDAESIRSLSDPALRRRLDRMSTLFEDYLTILRPAFHVYSATAFAILRELLAAWYDGENEYAFQDLISGLPRRTAMLQEQVDLWELADLVRRTPRLRSALEEAPDGARFFGTVEDPANADWAGGFRGAYAAFLAEHGHRGHQDRDIWYPRRSEDPSLDLQNLRSLIAADTPSPVENEHRLVAKREAAMADVLDNVRRGALGPLRVRIVQAVVDYIHRFLVLRDDERPFADRITMAKKLAAVEIGRRAHERGLVEEPDGFYFLAREELYGLLDGRPATPLVRAKIANRRRVFEAFLARTEIPPEYLRGGVPMEVDDGTDTGTDGVYQGVGTARGTVTGTARIVGDLRNIDRVRQGDILVCNSTDPGWTPVFGLLSGLVLEAGGMLSHGACLSREYGLPAVTLAGAMQKITDGCTIQVNGDNGRVAVVAGE